MQSMKGVGRGRSAQEVRSLGGHRRRVDRCTRRRAGPGGPHEAGGRCAGDRGGRSGHAAGRYREVTHAAVWVPTGSGSYRITDLGTLPGDETSTANAINAGGVIAGFSTAPGGISHAVVWAPTGSGSYRMTKLESITADGTSDALALNDAGQVAGDAASADGTVDRAVLWTPTGSGSYRITDLGTLPGDTLAFASAIDSNGRVAGLSANAAGDSHGAVWSP